MDIPAFLTLFLSCFSKSSVILKFSLIVSFSNIMILSSLLRDSGLNVDSRLSSAIFSYLSLSTVFDPDENPILPLFIMSAPYPALDVMMIIVFLKSTLLPSESVSCPSSRT